MSVLERMHALDLDLDRYLNRVIPRSPIHRFPTLISRFLGYRKTQPEDVGNVLGTFWSLLGAFCGLALVAAVFKNTESIQRHHPPVLIASFGASAVLEYNAIRSPFGQPRNALLGHTFSAIIGVGISKLFQLHPDYESIKWIAGAIACGIASAVMLLTATVHPPGGASAVLAATEPAVIAMGWYFVGLVMWGTALMLLVAMITNNIQRQFPSYWWTPSDLNGPTKTDEEEIPVERMKAKKSHREEKQRHDGQMQMIQITGNRVILPEDLSLNEDEAKLLEGLRLALRRRVDVEQKREDIEKPEPKSAWSSKEFIIVQDRSETGEESRRMQQQPSAC